MYDIIYRREKNSEVDKMIICPVCNKKMTRIERKYICEGNHNFDISKYGHVNL
ncbi:MAG: putative RNA methyltransferase, partial [Cetobacterium sp.]